ncbi:uncharacterized protein LOC142624160 [Castanea sativa]|uniref:uncharacterized protein LOC142624160 n=1 Tax=Castanea sativa TaxID=21020 RepID=UPI003F6500E1
MVPMHVKDLDDTFQTLKKYKLRLNAFKYSFGVGSSKFLGYMVTHRGIEVNPAQARAINNLQPPQNLKEVQKLTGMTAALNGFIFRSADRCRPFFQLLNKLKGFEWTKECALAFQQLKEYLSRLPIMSRPEVDKILFAYIAVAIHAVSLVLIRDDSGIQRPVYYVSKSLHEAEVRYLQLEKAILAIVHATRKLPHYFQSHAVVVLTQPPLKSVLRSADYSGRVAKWGTILGAFDIKYMSRTSVKGQVLADLVVEFAEPSLEESAKGLHMDEKSVGVISYKDSVTWKVSVDGAANQRGLSMGLVLVSPEGLMFEKSLRLGFSATNNKAKYEALMVGMDMVQKIRGKSVQMFSDSQLVVGQVVGTLEARDPRMREYLTRVRCLQSKLDSFTLMHISRSGNTHADSLATFATSSAQGLPRVILVEDLLKPARTAIDAVRIHQVRFRPSWMDPIVSFLKSDVLPEKKSKADKVCRKASRFWLFEDQKLYKRSFSRPYLLCINLEVTESLLEELHEGICGTYPQGNGQVEAVNKVILSGLKKRLDDAKGRSTGETPFSMTYGAETVIPLETGFPTLRTSSFIPSNNEGLLEKNLDLIEERRENAMVQLTYYQHKLKREYDAHVKLRPLAPEDLVLRKVLGTTKNPA